MLTVVIALAVGVWVTADVLLGGPWTVLDHRLSDLVRGTGIRASDRPQPESALKLAVYSLTLFGARWMLLGVVLPFVAWVSWRHRSWRPLFRLGVLFALLTVSVYALKYQIGRTAPVVDLLHTAAGQSFPSGHTANAVLGYSLVAWLAAQYGVPARLRAPIVTVRWAGPVLAAVGMLLLDYHWLSDLVAGLALGVVLLYVLHLIDALTLRDWRGGRHRQPAGLAARAGGSPAGVAAGGVDKVQSSERQ